MFWDRMFIKTCSISTYKNKESIFSQIKSFIEATKVEIFGSFSFFNCLVMIHNWNSNSSELYKNISKLSSFKSILTVFTSIFEILFNNGFFQDEFLKTQTKHFIQNNFEHLIKIDFESSMKIIHPYIQNEEWIILLKSVEFCPNILKQIISHDLFPTKNLNLNYLKNILLLKFDQKNILKQNVELNILFNDLFEISTDLELKFCSFYLNMKIGNYTKALIHISAFIEEDIFSSFQYLDEIFYILSSHPNIFKKIEPLKVKLTRTYSMCLTIYSFLIIN